MARLLSGIWVLIATGLIAVHFVVFRRYCILEFSVECIFWVAVVTVAITAAALLYGCNYRGLCRSDHYYALKSLIPASIPSLYIACFVVMLLREWGDADFPHAWFWLHVSILSVTVVLAVVGWVRQWPESHLAGLALVGVFATAVHTFSMLWVCWDYGTTLWFEDIALNMALLLFALPGLCAALACLAAVMLTSPRSRDSFNRRLRKIAGLKSE